MSDPTDPTFSEGVTALIAAWRGRAELERLSKKYPKRGTDVPR